MSDAGFRSQTTRITGFTGSAHGSVDPGAEQVQRSQQHVNVTQFRHDELPAV
jgi:hypothetical protein